MIDFALGKSVAMEAAPAAQGANPFGFFTKFCATVR